jgi:DNA end-binding protein Ku
MSRPVWKGAIAFGLVQVPVELHSATIRDGVDFSMLDRRDLAPVGYKRYNKRSGVDVPWDDIVKGYEYEEDRYVVLSDEDFRLANVTATQTVEIFGFAEAASIPDYYFESPYVLIPAKRGEKAYALLREALRRTGRVGLATLVIRNRQDVCVVQPEGDHLMVLVLRYRAELKGLDAFPIAEPADGRGYTQRELDMAERLVRDMEEAFEPEKYTDRYRDDLMQRIEAKIAAGETEVVTPPGEDAEAPAAGGSNVVDLMTLLKRSLETRDGKSTARRGEERASVTPLRRRSAPAKKAPAAKTRRKSATARRAAR